MKNLFLFILAAFAFTNVAFSYEPDPSAYSPYTYDCRAKSLEWATASYFHLKQGFKNGVVLNGRDVLFKDYEVKGETKYDTLNYYKGSIKSLSAETLILSWSLQSGTLFGKAFLVSKSGSVSTYDCEIDWSPY